VKIAISSDEIAIFASTIGIFQVRITILFTEIAVILEKEDNLKTAFSLFLKKNEGKFYRLTIPIRWLLFYKKELEVKKSIPVS
jgi:dihydroorotase